jgi:hypothetical protein
MKKKKMKFSGLLKGLIIEQGRYEILKKTYTQPKKKGDKVKPARMKPEQLDTIILGDPTTRRDGDKIKKAGTYSPWLIKQFLKLEPEADYGTTQFKDEMTELQRLFFEDLYKSTEALKKFDRFKGQIEQDKRDINKHNIESLIDITMDFSLDKTKASKEEKKAAATTYEHPGGEVIFRGSDWTVVKIEDQGKLGQDAACFYGGHHLYSSKGESSWCTSSPGGNMFRHYIKDGPLYVLIPNEAKSFRDDKIKTGEKTGLPALRYQFHFPSNQYMDPDDRQINLINFLNENPELKEVFKPEFMKGLTGTEGTSVSVEYPRDSASKFIALYGFDEFFESLPDNLERLDFVKSSNRYRNDPDTSDMAVELPKSVGRFKNLNALHLEGILNKLPKEIGELKDLVFLSLPNNPNLTSLPEEVSKLNNLQVINLKNSPNVKIPDEIENKKGLHIFR